MLLNLWDIDMLTQNFMNLYSLTGSQICNIIRRLHLNKNSDSVSIFCEETGMKLDEVEVSDDVEFVGKIVSTTTDNFSYIKKSGLVPIDVLLESESPISNHLNKYQLKIMPSEHKLFYKGKQFHIPAYGEECEWCAYGEDRCRFEDKRYKDMYCPYLKAILPLALKLYRDRSEIELFLLASTEEMLGYSTVKYYPEIFVTIDDLVKNLFKKKLNIGSEWAEQKQHSYIVTVDVKYNDMSYRNNYISGTDGGDATDIYLAYEQFCFKTYDYAEEMPKCFWDNVWLIRTCLNRLCSSDGIYNEICAGIKHNVKIPYDKLKIDLV